MKFYASRIVEQLEAKVRLHSRDKLNKLDLENFYSACSVLVPTRGDMPGKYNFKETLNNPDSIAALAAKGVVLQNFKEMINLYRHYPYSSWNTVKQKELTALSSMVPIPLAAMKDYKGIKYSQWDLDTTTGSYGNFLASFTSLNQDQKDKMEYLYNRIRERLDASPELLAWARQHTTNMHAPNKLPIQETYKDFSELWNQSFPNTSVGRLCRVCLLQVWLAGELRVPGKTVLNPYDWDEIPEYIPPRASSTHTPLEDL